MTMPPEHKFTASSIPKGINWLTLHADMFLGREGGWGEDSSCKKKHYFEVCSAAQAQWKTSCSLSIFGRFRWAAATYSELPAVSEEYLQINSDINQSLPNNTSNHLRYGFHTSTSTNFPSMVTHFPFVSRNSAP